MIYDIAVIKVWSDMELINFVTYISRDVFSHVTDHTNSPPRLENRFLDMGRKIQFRILYHSKVFMLFDNWYLCLIKIQRGMWGLGTLMRKTNLNCLLIFIGIKLHFPLMIPVRSSFKIFIKFLGSYLFIINRRKQPGTACLFLSGLNCIFH